MEQVGQEVLDEIVRRIVAELLEVPVEKADSHLPHIASLTRRHVCTVE